jgi:hypothetical protein
MSGGGWPWTEAIAFDGGEEVHGRNQRPDSRHCDPGRRIGNPRDARFFERRMAVADVATALRTDPDAVDRHYHAAIRTLRRHFSLRDGGAEPIDRQVTVDSSQLSAISLAES